MTSADQESWSFATARVPAAFGAAIHPLTPGVQHAWGGEQTLCGLPEEQIELYRHLFNHGDDSACPTCRQRAAVAPTQPCGQERLHDQVLAAAVGPMRDDLLDALRRGVEIKLWINGPARGLATHYARLDRIVEGGPALVEALNVDGSVGLARVEQGQWQFIVVLPDHGPALIGRATTDG
ncbi:hypothetical protein [Micromonospora parathelypteridis]|uniref:Uncharacterized protein n=1 Tax=Micromonospora parathelypteridis TaxID=1839617 RepID=A0A840W9P1_9ACTN|nr:hypothetical protein [Micromonospora parathelypteridis]MBB5481440.1 hypothetical protein [Micromonospora parathelypteridis]GGO18493.1 hypothetical protein GCM10011576_33540 [Micromonospora parathelypteridis]